MVATPAMLAEVARGGSEGDVDLHAGVGLDLRRDVRELVAVQAGSQQYAEHEPVADDHLLDVQDLDARPIVQSGQGGEQRCRQTRPVTSGERD